MAIAIEMELNTYNINYQSLTTQEDNIVQILCNDDEEREHIKHLMMDHQYALCLEMEGSRFFSRYVNDDEIKYFNALAEHNRKQKLKQMKLNMDEHARLAKEI